MDRLTRLILSSPAAADGSTSTLWRPRAPDEAATTVLQDATGEWVPAAHPIEIRVTGGASEQEAANVAD